MDQHAWNSTSARADDLGGARAGKPSGEDLDNHRGIDDRRDDLRAAAATRAVLDVDIEDPFEQARLPNAR